MDRVKITGRVTILQDGELVYKEIPNKWVNYGLRGLCSFMCGNYITSAGSQYAYMWSGSSQTNGLNIRVGTNTATATTFSLTELVTPVTVNPTTMTGSAVTNAAAGIWNITFTAYWNAGLITGTIGEVGLYLAPIDNINANWTESGATGKTQRMVSRISVADGNFTAFTPDVNKTLVIEWKVGVSQ